MPRSRPFAQVDVFSAVAYRGNPLAVVLDGQGISDTDMQQMARWTHLSETTFVLPATSTEADYRLRIFTPGARCHSPDTPPWAQRTPGWRVVDPPAIRSWSCSSARPG